MRRALSFASLALLAIAAASCNDTDPDAPRGATSIRPNLHQAPSAELEADSSAPVVVLWDTAARRPRRIRGSFPSTEIDPERAARAFLQRHAALLQLREDGRDLTLVTTREGIAGTYLRFQQIQETLPVLGGEVIVLVAEE